MTDLLSWPKSTSVLDPAIMDLGSLILGRVESGELMGTAQTVGYHPRANNPRPIEVTLQAGDERAEIGTNGHVLLVLAPTSDEQLSTRA